MTQDSSRAISTVFGRARVFLPVIHLPLDLDGAQRAVEIALAADADGVFLINQGTAAETILDVLIPELRRSFGNTLWIGVNLLGWSVADVIRAHDADARRIDGIWSDDAGVDALDLARFRAEKYAVERARAETRWGGMYFAGTAFKTQAEIPIDRLGLVGQRAASFADVVTTSGRGTGVAADVARVRRLREAVPGAPLALASGITPENVGSYLRDVDAYLVASGIEANFGVLDPARTRALSDAVHAFAP